MKNEVSPLCSLSAGEAGLCPVGEKYFEKQEKEIFTVNQ